MEERNPDELIFSYAEKSGRLLAQRDILLTILKTTIQFTGDSSTKKYLRESLERFEALHVNGKDGIPYGS